MKKIKINFFVLGLFLLLWATNGYVIFGNIGKYTSLFLGILFMVTSLINIKIDSRSLRLIFVSFYILIFYIFLSYFLDQETFNPLIIAFDFVNFCLFILGCILGKMKDHEIRIRGPIIIFISILTIISSFIYYTRQVGFNYDIGKRGLGDENLNEVGVAYIHAQIFILLIWFLFRKNSFLIKTLLIIALISVLLIMLITESRGAILFLFVICFFVFFKNIFNLIKIKNLLSISITIMALTVLINTPLVQNKIESFTERFAVLFLASSIKNKEDRSVKARLEIQSDFFNNYEKMFFGKYNYSPYPHNQFIEIYMRWGVFGIPIFIISLLSFINGIRFYKEQKEYKSSLKFLLFLLFLFCYLQSMTSLSLDNNRLLWLGFGLFLSNYKLKKYSELKNY